MWAKLLFKFVRIKVFVHQDERPQWVIHFKGIKFLLAYDTQR